MNIKGYAPGWQLRCRKCGFTQDAANAGIVRIRAFGVRAGTFGKKLILRRCPKCRQIGFHALELEHDPIDSHFEQKFVKIIIILLLFLAIFPPSLFFGIRYELSKATVYQQAVEQISHNPDVIKALGQPIECKMWNGSIQNGHAEIHFRVNGSKNSGIAYIIADKKEKNWDYQKLVIVLNDGQQIILPVHNTRF